MNDVELKAARLDEFLKDETVQEAFAVLREQAYQNFLAAETDAERASAQATAKVVDTLGTALRAVVDAGTRARIERERAERSPASRPTE